jgi:hypothetical protein
MMEDGENDQLNPIENEIQVEISPPIIESHPPPPPPPPQPHDDQLKQDQGDDSHDLAAQVRHVATTAGNTLVDITVSVAHKTEDLIHKVTESHKSEQETTGDTNLEIQNNQDDQTEQQPVSAKVLHVAASAGKTVVDLSVSAAKKTGDVLHKAVETATEVINKHNNKQGAEEKEGSPENPEQQIEEPSELVSAKVLQAAATAGKTVVDLSVTAAKYTGEVINKVATSAGEVLNKDKQQPADEDTAQQEGTDEKVTEQSNEGNPNPSRMWSSVRRMSEKVIHTTSTTLSKASTIVHPKESEQSEPETPAQPSEPVEDRSRSDSIGKLWSSVRKMSLTAADHASAAIKAAEPVAISTANKVSSSAQMVWTTTKEKVLHGMNKSDETETEPTELNQEQETSISTVPAPVPVGEVVAEESRILEQIDPVIVADNVVPEEAEGN